MPRLRVSTIFAIGALCLISFILLSSTKSHSQTSGASSAPGDQKSSSLTDKLPSFDTPSFRFNFHTSAHKPPEQQNSTIGETKWYSDWRWLNPFSSSITLDEDRSVLPPLRQRTPIYTYYDTTLERDKESKRVDQELLQTWRRAWWAHGFRPIILGPADAQSNPLYESMQLRKLDPALELEVSQFLAWGQMGAGLLSSYYCFPMGPYDDDMLAYLRRGDFPLLTRFEGLGAGLFASQKSLINDATKDALEHGTLDKATSILDIIPKQRFKVEQPSSIAHYDSKTIESKYPSVAEKFTNTSATGRQELVNLINGHLQVTWQNSFRKGITVLKPMPKHTTALVEPSQQLAELLAECPKSPLPASCPPNRSKCSACVANKVEIITKAAFRNTTEEFTIGTIPHPYVRIMLNNQSDHITLAHIRRGTKRDEWLTEATKELLGTGRGSFSRVIGLKDTVASDVTQNRGLWLTFEQLPTTVFNKPVEGEKGPSLPDDFLSELDWYFGFQIPRAHVSKGESVTPVPGPERRPKSPPGLPVPKRKSWDVDPPDEKAYALEVELLGKGRDAITSKDRGISKMREISEMWNLADTEAWKFVRAWRARSTMERLKWEEEEKGYGVSGSAKGSGRWFTRRRS